MHGRASLTYGVLRMSGLPVVTVTVHAPVICFGSFFLYFGESTWSISTDDGSLTRRLTGTVVPERRINHDNVYFVSINALLMLITALLE